MSLVAHSQGYTSRRVLHLRERSAHSATPVIRESDRRFCFYIWEPSTIMSCWSISRATSLVFGKRSIDHALALGCPLRQ